MPLRRRDPGVPDGEFADLTSRYERQGTAMADAAALFERGDHAGAVEAFRRLIGDPELPEQDRSVMLVNLAVVERTRGVDAAGLERIYDEGIEAERSVMRGFVRQTKAAWLAEVGRRDEALGLIDELLAEPWATGAERLGLIEQRRQLGG